MSPKKKKSSRKKKEPAPRVDKAGPKEEKKTKSSSPPTSKESRPPYRLPSWLPLLLILAAGLAFRLSSTMWEPQLYPDSMQYMHLAKEIRDGTFFSDNFDLDEGFIKSRHLPPFYSLLISPFAGTQADLEKVGISISLFLSLLTLALVYWGLKTAFSRRAAIAGASILAFHAFTLRYASPILTEATFTFFYAAVVCFSIYALNRPALWKFALCGVLCSCAYMTRDVGISAPAIVLAFAFFKFFFMDKLPWKRTVSLLLALVLTFLAFTAPYFVHIRVRTGKWGLTAQMSNTNLTRQIQLFGGDRFDRDRLQSHKKGTGMVGEETAKGTGDLVKLLPGLVKKTFTNMGSYGKELGGKWTPLVLVLVFTGIGGAFFRYRREKQGPPLFYAVYVAVWILQLWALYSLITPYMVDDRYMYPLVVPGIMMAALGIEHSSRRISDTLSLSSSDDRLSTYVLLLVLLVLAVVFTVFSYLLVDYWTVKHYMNANSDFLGSVLVFYLAAPALMFMLIAAYGSRTFPGLLFKPGRALITGAGLFAAGVVLAVIFSRVHELYEFVRNNNLTHKNVDGLFRNLFLPYLPAVFLMGAGLGLFLMAAVKKSPFLSSRFLAWFPAFLVAAIFFCQYTNLYSVITEADTSIQSMASKYASGHKEAAGDIKDEVPSGKIIASRKPFIAYYLDGNWYRDEEGRPIPKTLPEVQKLINQGKIDYIVADSHTFRALRPAIVELALGTSDIKNARIIYSRFFPEYRRIITIYECGVKEKEVPYRGSASEHLQKASEYLEAGNYPFALRELRRAVEYDKDNAKAWKTTTQILDLYYVLVRRRSVPTLVLAPHVMQGLLHAYERYSSINPQDREAQRKYERIKDTFEREKKKLENADRRRR